MNTAPEIRPDRAVLARIATECAASCHKLLHGIQQVRQSILTEVRSRLGLDDRLVRRALNEAESMAWETGYPQLFFPTLALEKVQTVAGASNDR